MWLSTILLVCVITYVSSATCNRRNQIYTGDSKVEWTATLNGEEKPEILSPNQVGIFGEDGVNTVVVTPNLNPSTIMLQEVKLQTKNAVEVKVVEGDQTETYESGVNWKETSFKFKGEMANQVTILFKGGVGGEVAIRIVYVKACVPVDWCPWSKWTTCSVSCDKGVTTRTRQCDCENPDPELFSCSGKSEMKKSCNLASCKPPLVEQFDKRLDQFENVWDVQLDELGQFYTKNTLQIRQGQPICQGRQCVIKDVEAIKAKYPILELNVLFAVQMSEVRVYTVHVTTGYNKDRTKIIPPELRFLIVWLKVGNRWEIDAQALTDDREPSFFDQ